MDFTSPETQQFIALLIAVGSGLLGVSLQRKTPDTTRTLTRLGKKRDTGEMTEVIDGINQKRISKLETDQAVVKTRVDQLQVQVKRNEQSIRDLHKSLDEEFAALRQSQDKGFADLQAQFNQLILKLIPKG